MTVSSSVCQIYSDITEDNHKPQNHLGSCDKTHFVIVNRNKTFPLNIDQIYNNNQPIRG